MFAARFAKASPRRDAFGRARVCVRSTLERDAQVSCQTHGAEQNARLWEPMGSGNPDLHACQRANTSQQSPETHGALPSLRGIVEVVTGVPGPLRCSEAVPRSGRRITHLDMFGNRLVRSPRGDPEVAHLDLFGRRLDTDPKRRACQRSMARPSRRFTVRALRCFVFGASVPFDWPPLLRFRGRACSASSTSIASGSWLLPPDPSCFQFCLALA